MLLKVRQCDKTIGENALSILDLLDLNWGKWGRDESNGRLRFDDTIVLDAYNEHIQKIQGAAAEQKKAQEGIVAVEQAPQPH